MKLINKIKQQKENVFASDENVKIDSIMIDDNGELSSHFYIRHYHIGLEWQFAHKLNILLIGL